MRKKEDLSPVCSCTVIAVLLTINITSISTLKLSLDMVHVKDEQGQYSYVLNTLLIRNVASLGDCCIEMQSTN